MWLAYVARAAVDAKLAGPHVAGMAEIRQRCAEAIRAAQASGEAPGELDPAREALLLAAFVDGLIVDMLGDPASLSAEVAVDALGAYLDRLFSAGSARGRR